MKRLYKGKCTKCRTKHEVEVKAHTDVSVIPHILGTCRRCDYEPYITLEVEPIASGD